VKGKRREKRIKRRKSRDFLEASIGKPQPRTENPQP